MATTYSVCKKCGNTKEKSTKSLCPECYELWRSNCINNLKGGYKPKLRKCRTCDAQYIPIGPSNVNCKDCSLVISNEKKKISNDNYRRRKGVKVGVGSGNNQGLGVTHHSYKNGIGIYKNLGKLNKQNKCERCNFDFNLSREEKHQACVHHKDYNRNNNNPSNLELLCRSCHAKEHKLFNNFYH